MNFSKITFIVLFSILTSSAHSADHVLGQTVTVSRSIPLRLDDCKKNWLVSVSNVGNGAPTLEYGGCSVVTQSVPSGEVVACDNAAVNVGRVNRASVNSSSNNLSYWECAPRYIQANYLCMDTQAQFAIRLFNSGYSIQQLSPGRIDRREFMGGSFSENEKCIRNLFAATGASRNILILKPVPMATAVPSAQAPSNPPVNVPGPVNGPGMLKP